MRQVEVIGAGQMGTGIAQVCALADFGVLLIDRDPEALPRARSAIAGRLDSRVRKEALDIRESEAALRRLQLTADIKQLSSCDLVVEAVTEDATIKCSVFQQICPYLKPNTILATNTSSISITRLAASTDRPERFIGIHFMNPVPAMHLVELIRGIATDERTFRVARKFVADLGKTATVAEDFPAFIVHRILLPMINEAIYTLYEGVGSVEAIDTAMRLGANHPMGPLQLADFIGLDTCLSIMQALHEGLADSKYRPCPLLVKYVEAGWIGRKVKRGFYDYRGEQPVPTRYG
jgi:3-hydroxybutyryl-CoA dehydrogenase